VGAGDVIITEQYWSYGRWRLAGQGTAVAPAVTSVKGFDSTAAILEQSWFDNRFREGFRLYVLHSTEWGGTAPWWRTEAQLGMALAAGLKIGAYTRDPTTWLAGIDACGQYKSRLQFFALDVETEGAVPGQPGKPITQAMVDGIATRGYRPIIYSGSGMWSGVMGATTAFSVVPLWDTNTAAPPAVGSWVPDVETPTPVAYGGWNTAGNKRVIVQQAFNVEIDGITLDLNSVRASFLLDK
jgi:hypothetical protein